MVRSSSYERSRSYWIISLERRLLQSYEPTPSKKSCLQTLALALSSGEAINFSNDTLSKLSVQIESVKSYTTEIPKSRVGSKVYPASLSDLKKTPYTIYGDEPFDAIAIISHPPGEILVMTKLLASRNGVLNSVMDNVFNSIKKDHRKLFWTAAADDENRSWHFERADGSFTRAGKSLFWYGIQDVAEVEKAVKEMEEKGRVDRAFLPVGPSIHPHRIPTSTQSRSFSTLARPTSFIKAGGSRGYATSTEPKESSINRWREAIPAKLSYRFSILIPISAYPMSLLDN